MGIYVIIDILIFATCLVALKTKCDLRFYHPATWLLFYHFMANTLRFIAVANGAELAFSNYPGISGASYTELKRAILLTDLSLLVTSLFIIIAENSKMEKLVYVKETLANPNIVKKILLFTIPLGIWGALTQLYIPAVTFDGPAVTVQTSYTSLIQSWFGLSMLLLIYFKGFKKEYVIPQLVYLFIIAIQGYHRYRLVLPLIFLISTYLVSHDLKWPKRKYILMLLGLSFLFYPLKSIGRIIQEEGSFDNISEVVFSSFIETTKGNQGDQAFLDQFAMTLTEIDNQGKLYLGETILPILVSPIPRFLWSEKPALNQWQAEISTIHRPFDEIGSVATIYGESYANFGYLGIILLPAILFFILTKWYKRMIFADKKSIEFLFYLLVISCLVQVLRDGFVSLFLFPVVNSMPIFLIFLIHKMLYNPAVTLVKIRYVKKVT